eukprot:scaffold80720_cov71-Phaeocystis_antarctica.AAC.9
MAPRAGSRSCKRPRRANGSGARRGTCTRGGAVCSTTSGSVSLTQALRSRNAALGSAACRTERRSSGASCRAQRARPSRPACGVWHDACCGAPESCRAERSTSCAPGAAAMRMMTHSAACSIGSGSRPQRDAAKRTSTLSVPPVSKGAANCVGNGVAVVLVGIDPSSRTDGRQPLPMSVTSSHRVWYM